MKSESNVFLAWCLVSVRHLPTQHKNTIKTVFVTLVNVRVSWKLVLKLKIHFFLRINDCLEPICKVVSMILLVIFKICSICSNLLKSGKNLPYPQVGSH